jgi:hypothetical protein
MTLQLAALRQAPWLPLALVPIVGGATLAMLAQMVAFPHDTAESRLCDQAVEALLHSHELIEVERAGIIIHEVNCGIGRRLPP